jgi:hypothetical protein
MPSMPPAAPKNSEENEKMLAPHIFGIKPPIVDPTSMPIQTACFMEKVYNRGAGEKKTTA